MFYGDTGRSAAMRHELPISIIDPFLLAVVDGRTHVVVNGLEDERVAAAVPGAVGHDIADLGFGELLDSGMGAYQIGLELAAGLERLGAIVASWPVSMLLVACWAVFHRLAGVLRPGCARQGC